MTRSRQIATLLVFALGLSAAFAPGAFAAEGIGAAKRLGGGKIKTTEASTPRANTGTAKEQLAIATKSPAAGATVSGSVVWEVSLLAGTPSKIEFAVDGSVVGSDTTAPYAVSL